MIFPVRLLVAVALCGVLCAASAAAQEDVITHARAEAAAGRRGAAITLLERHLDSNPSDVDARLVYGLVLSWDGKYDEARTALKAVLAQAPEYLDARVALMNVEWWSGRVAEAREQVRLVLAVDPGNSQARLVKQRLDARTRPWSVGGAATTDSFNDARSTWREFSMTVGRDTPVGPIIARGSDAERFGLDDRQFELEFYPTFRAGTYAFVGLGASADHALYPNQRYSFDLYQSLGHGLEVSGGMRHLGFENAANLYLVTLSKYAGNWMFTGKVSLVPDDRTGDSWSYHALARRYFGDQGTSFVGAGYSHGFTREEPRGAGDLLRVDADTVRAQADLDVNPGLRFSFSASSGRQQRAVSTPLWQTTLSAGLTTRF